MLTQTRMTSAEFLALPETMARLELIDGEVIIHAELDMSPAPAADHQRGVRRSSRVIETLMPDGEVFFAPFDVRLNEQTTLQPDVFWLSPARLAQLGDGGYLDGAPDLVVEVLSPGTAHLDRGRKFKLYEQYGVREYWLVDMQSRYVEVYRRAGDKFDRIGAFAPGEIFTSAVLNDAQIDPAAFFSDGV